jgi:tRNA(Ile)-lysidine synthase
VVTGHTLDDQAETVLIRMSRGSGLAGLAAMAPVAPLPIADASGIALVRPLLEVPKARLIATLEQAKVAFAADPSNRDPRFTRARLRELMPALAREGLDARRLALLVRRIRRAEATIETAVRVAAEALAQLPEPAPGPVAFDAKRFAALPAEVALRLLGRTIAWVGEGPVELAKLEVLHDALDAAFAGAPAPRGSFRLRRTLAGALVTLTERRLTVERAPPRADTRYARP